jgi:hypothetical protein
MQKRGIVTITTVALFLVALASSAIAGTYPQDHNGWSIGFGFGGASAGLSDDSGNSSDREGGGMGNFRVGYPLNEKVSIGLEGNAWTKSQDGVTLTFGATTVGVAFYPSDGWVMRGGVGLGSTTLSASSGNTTVTSSESGLGLHGAVGYDFRLARTFAIGPQVDAGYTTFDGGSANWFGAGVQFNWYFIPKK